MPDIQGLIDQMASTGAINRIARNRAAQFGTRTRRLIGAEVLPAQDQEENSYTDDTVRYRTVVANAGTRYSPVVLKGNAYTGSVEVKLFDIDIGSELTSRDYDALIRYLNRNDSMDAMANITNFLNTTVNMGLEELREVYRWQAIEKALVQRRGANGYSEDIAYSNPAGHRAVAAAAWSLSTTDPFVDIFDRVQLLADKGYQVSRIITSRNVASILGNNEKVRTRTGAITVNVGGGLVVQGGRASLSQINGALQAEGLPALELYDLIYRTQTGTQRFISDDVMIFLATTGRDAALELGDQTGTVELLPDTLGYYGVGRAAGQSGPGRGMQAVHKTDKPPRGEGQGFEHATGHNGQRAANEAPNAEAETSVESNLASVNEPAHREARERGRARR